MSKYGNKPIVVDGQTYDSTAEAIEAQELEIRRRAKDIRRWEPQFPVEFRKNGELICKHFIDFLIIYPDGRRELKEIKGKETDVWKLKKKMLFIFYGIGGDKIRYKRREYTYVLQKVNARWQDKYKNFKT